MRVNPLVALRLRSMPKLANPCVGPYHRRLMADVETAVATREEAAGNAGDARRVERKAAIKPDRRAVLKRMPACEDHAATSREVGIAFADAEESHLVAKFPVIAISRESTPTFRIVRLVFMRSCVKQSAVHDRRQRSCAIAVCPTVGRAAFSRARRARRVDWQYAHTLPGRPRVMSHHRNGSTGGGLRPVDAPRFPPIGPHRGPGSAYNPLVVPSRPCAITMRSCFPVLSSSPPTSRRVGSARPDSPACRRDDRWTLHLTGGANWQPRRPRSSEPPTGAGGRRLSGSGSIHECQGRFKLRYETVD